MIDIRGHRCQMKTDQAHVMGQWHPGHHAVIVAHVHTLQNRVKVDQQIPVGQHNAFGRAGRAGGKLNQCDVIRYRGVQYGIARRRLRRAWLQQLLIK